MDSHNDGERMVHARINLRRLTSILVASLLLPIGAALALDLSLGWMPLLTIAATVIFVPLSTVLVVRAILAELDRVINQVAPLEPD
jgi:hypothetical protein